MSAAVAILAVMNTTHLAAPIKRIIASALDIPALTPEDRRTVGELIDQVDTTTTHYRPMPHTTDTVDKYSGSLKDLLIQAREVVARHSDPAA